MHFYSVPGPSLPFSKPLVKQLLLALQSNAPQSEIYVQLSTNVKSAKRPRIVVDTIKINCLLAYNPGPDILFLDFTLCEYL